METFDMIADERRAMADLIEGLTEPQLATQSLCGKWDVRTVAAHLMVGPTVSIPTVMVEMVKNGFNFDKVNDRLAVAMARRPVSEIAAILRDKAGSRFTPPTMGPEAPLTDLLVHGQDIRRPLGMAYVPPPDRVKRALDFVTTGAPRGFTVKGRLAGLQLTATDIDWTTGTGAEVSGTAEALLLGATGRTVVLDELDGDGVAILRARLTSS